MLESLVVFLPTPHEGGQFVGNIHVPPSEQSVPRYFELLVLCEPQVF